MDNFIWSSRMERNNHGAKAKGNSLHEKRNTLKQKYYIVSEKREWCLPNIKMTHLRQRNQMIVCQKPRFYHMVAYKIRELRCDSIFVKRVRDLSMNNVPTKVFMDPKSISCERSSWPPRSGWRWLLQAAPRSTPGRSGWRGPGGWGSRGAPGQGGPIRPCNGLDQARRCQEEGAVKEAIFFKKKKKD